ncbi:MAG: hypothetical protein ACUVYA_13815 [Planctomycetota bacterium]
MATDNKKEKKDAGTGRKAASPMDRIFWPLLGLAAVFFLAERFRPSLSSPWAEIVTVVQILCPIVAAILLIRAYPHPLRTFQRKLAAERANYEREAKRKKKKKRPY